MLLQIVAKELLENMVNARFIAAAVISLVLVLSTVVVLDRSYEVRMNDYLSRSAVQEEFIDRYGHANRMEWMASPMRMPSRFEVLVLGINTEWAEENFISNPLPGLFMRLDLVSIVTLVMSLMAVLLSYNAISGEREAGLLRLMLSSGASRASILLGKFLGGSISLLVPFTVGVLAGLLYLLAGGDVATTGTDLVIILLLLGAAWLLIAAFHALGLLCSARSRSSAESALKALAGWAVLVLIVPNVSPFIAARFFPVPSAARIEMMTRQLTDVERDEIIRQREQELLRGPFADVAPALTRSQQELEERAGGDPVFRERFAAYGRAYDDMVQEVNKEQRAKADKIRGDAALRAQRQEQAASLFASLSPVSDFLFLATDLTETGLPGETRWAGQAAAYQRDLRRFANERYQQEKAKNPAFGFNDYLDLRDRATFVYQPAGFGERAAGVLGNIGLLLAFAVIFLGAGLVSILRYDVR